MTDQDSQKNDVERGQCHPTLLKPRRGVKVPSKAGVAGEAVRPCWWRDRWSGGGGVPGVTGRDDRPLPRGDPPETTPPFRSAKEG